MRESGTDVVINLTAGLGAFLLPDPADESRALPGSDVCSVDERMEHLELCRPEIASLDITTGNQVEGPVEFVYLNTTRTLRSMAKRFQELNIKPELETFNAGDVEFGKALVREGLVSGPPLFQFVLGVKWGAPADSRTLLYMRDLLPSNALWAALGTGRLQMPVAAQTTLLGGNVRVGLEDNLYLRRGVFATNGQLVERAKIIIEALGYEVATPADARHMLGLRSQPWTERRGACAAMIAMDEVRRVAVVGGGTIGASWATFFLSRGLAVSICDPVAARRCYVEDYIQKAWPALVALHGRRLPRPDQWTFYERLSDAVAKFSLSRKVSPRRLRSSARCSASLMAWCAPKP